MSKKYVIVGGVAGGATAAATDSDVLTNQPRLSCLRRDRMFLLPTADFPITLAV